VGERSPRLFESSTFNESFAQVSPDGRWLAYTSNESRRGEVYVQSFPKRGGGKWQVSKDGGTHARWRQDGRELFYLGPNGRLMVVPITGSNALDIGAAIPLFELHALVGRAIAPSGVGFRAQYDVARDGQRFLVNVPLEETRGSSINVVVNWPAALKK
jgi:hypothetical protein